MKIRLVPLEEKYYVFVLFENIEDKASLIEINSKLNYSMMLIQSLSHEMFTPLHHVLGISDRLYKRLSDDGNSGVGSRTNIQTASKRMEMRDEVLIIKQIGQGLTIFVQNILDFANIVNNTFEVYKQRFKVKELMDYLISIFSVKARHKNIRLRYECDKSMEMFSDYNRLAGLLFNFVDNSIKFTQKGGITIHAHCTQQGQVVFKVVDTGTGIDEADINKISEIFKDPFLADKTKASAGLGIGLRISLALIKTLSKGDLAIDISSEKNIGTTIQFEISQGFEPQTQTQTPIQASVMKKPSDNRQIIPMPPNKSHLHHVILDEAEEDIRSLKAIAFMKERKKLKNKSDLASQKPKSNKDSTPHSFSDFANDDAFNDCEDDDEGFEMSRKEIDMFDVDDIEVAQHIRKRSTRKLVSISIKHMESVDNGMASPREEDFEYDEEENLELKHHCRLCFT